MSYKVLITGATGFIGDALVRMIGGVADKIDFEVIPAVRRPVGLKNEVILDFEDAELYDKVNKLRKVDAIVHLGAKVDFNATAFEYLCNNVTSTAILSNWASNIGAYFIFASSISIYGNATLIKEVTDLNPETEYAESKYLAEQLVGLSGVDYLVMRLSGVYGNNGSTSLGINRAISEAQRGIMPTLYGIGAGKRNYIYIVDLVKLIVFCLKSRITGTHLIAGEEKISIADMLQGICDTFLPGQSPVLKDGESSGDQIVVPSEELHWDFRKFDDALQHMKLWWEKA